MKTLFAIRHAKSSWDSASLGDHDRPLNDRGNRDAPVMGAALLERNIKPDALISSTANRARTTAEIIAECLDFPKSDIILDRNLYLAPAQTWLRTAQNIDESAETAMLFGHNPGMHDFVSLITKDDPVDHFPTLGTAILRFDVEFWGEIDWSTASLVEFLYPKGLAED